MRTRPETHTQDMPTQREQVGTRLGSRIIVDPATCTQWVVIEIRDAPYDRRDASSLVFSTEGVMRRVRNYPRNWLELTDAELLRLSTQR